jgi:hypothetical protein
VQDRLDFYIINPYGDVQTFMCPAAAGKEDYISHFISVQKDSTISVYPRGQLNEVKGCHCNYKRERIEYLMVHVPTQIYRTGPWPTGTSPCISHPAHYSLYVGPSQLANRIAYQSQTFSYTITHGLTVEIPSYV